MSARLHDLTMPSSRTPDSPHGGSARRRRVLAAGLIPLQLFLAAGWLRAGTEKVIDPTWWNADALRGFLVEQHPEMLPWFAWFSDVLVEPLALVVAWAVLVTQLIIGGCLLTNRSVRPALWAGIVLNVAFTMAGRVNPSAFYLVMEITLLFALARSVSEPVAVRRAVAWLIPATFFLPFVRTLHPRDVIDDPALMSVFLCVVASVTTIAVSVPPARMVAIASQHRCGRSACALLSWFGSDPGSKEVSGNRAVAGDVVGADRGTRSDRSGLDIGVQ